jgi:hypothetical protein
MIRLLPWVLVFGLSVFSFLQWQTINSLEVQHVEISKEVIKGSKNNKGKMLSVSGSDSARSKVHLNNPRKGFSVEESKHKEERNNDVLQVPISESIESQEMDALIEERAWQRVTEIEENQHQERLDMISERIQEKVDSLGEKQDWSDEVHQQMGTILLTSMQDKMDLRQKIKNGEIEREEYHQYAEDIRDSRNEQIIDLLGEEEFQSIEEELHPHRGPHR